MEKIRKIMKKRKNEEGSADLIVTLATIPFAVFLILALIDISLFLNTKSHVQSTLRDGVRQAAMWGGSGGPEHVRLNVSGQPTAANIKDKIWNKEDKVCTHSHCKAEPIVGCTEQTVANAGTPITCTVTYSYSSIVPGADLLGFGAITNAPFTATEYSLSETGYGG